MQLQQVLLNLLVNACDAMESNPPEDRNVTFTAFIAQNEMRIGVLDCGVGLPDDVETLFRPFYTTKASGLEHGSFNLPLTGDLAWRQAVGGAQGRARRRILCRAASGQRGGVTVGVEPRVAGR